MHALVVLSIVVMLAAAPARTQDALVVTDRAAVILNPVKPDSTEEFELGLAQLRAVLTANAESSHPRKRQQARGWTMYRAEEPIGKNVLYVFILNPSLPYADYSFKSILEDSLPAGEADLALRRLSGSLAGAQTVISMTPTPEPKGRVPAAVRPGQPARR